jgi:ubiquinone/menaquinone biosynthesis C-methylase UbiE
MAQKNGWKTPEILADRARNFLGNNFSGTVLDVGGGTGLLSEIIKSRHPLCKVFNIDITPEALVTSRDLGRCHGIVQGNGLKLPFRNGVFDTTFASGFFNNINDGLAAVKEMRRVTRRGGLVVFDCKMLDGQYCPEFIAHVRHNQREIIDALEPAMIYSQPQITGKKIGHPVEANIVLALLR